MGNRGDFEASFELASRSDAHVLITGPTGTGKTTLARRIHKAGKRASRPFVVINLASLHEGTLESELFGHERGAFTGAEQRRMGRLETASGGTVFLDEVGELSPRLQARLLEFLQSRTLTPVGSNRETRVDVRVLAATHKDLARAVARGEFREDLFHRLRVLSIEMRPLRERAEELDVIVHECLRDLCGETGRSVLRLSEEAAARLERYPWPGNIRELRNVLEHAVLSCRDGDISAADFPPWFLREQRAPSAEQGAPATLGVAELPFSLDYQDTLGRFEKEYLRRALDRYRGRVNRTASAIGISKATLIRRMRAYGLGQSS